MNKPLILVSNDDGVFASGLQMLISVAREFGEVFVVAPEKGESGMSHAISIVTPIRAKLIKKEEGLTVYSCNGTPVDCVKLALNQLMERKPDYVLSGINHGSNASISVIYSGTMGAAIEGCFNCIPSAGFSLLDHSPVADFSVSQKYVRIVLENLIKDGLPQGTCLNVNIPKLLEDEIKGIEVCRMTKGVWKEEYGKRTDPSGRNYYWLTGYFKNFEPDADDTDEWLLDKGYVTIVPIQVDLTAYDCIDRVKKWNLKK